jgi:asparagine synthase (glutamine-hydrolysing)
MISADGRLVIVFNGEIYNFQELRHELERAGCQFRTQSDTEVLLQAWQVWGAASVKRLKGMFAFALWDKSAQTLVLARDPLGKKPIYYSVRENRTLAFASELKGLFPCPWITRRMSAAAVEDYFCFGYVPDPKSIYADVAKLPPAHMLTWQRGRKPVVSAYWNLDFNQHHPVSAREAAEELSARLKLAVKQRMVADVTLGAFLSGGVDSSGIVAHMAQASTQPVRTCTMGFGERSHDERQYARVIADRYKTNHVEKIIPADFSARTPSLLSAVAATYDEPFADNSAVPTYQVCAAAREHVTVALSGDGGDEAFGGYRRYPWHMREHAVRKLMPQWFRKPVFGTLGRVYPKLAWAPRMFRARSTFRELSQTASAAYLNSVSQLSCDTRGQIYSDAFKKNLQGYHASEVIEDLMAEVPGGNPLLQAQYVDMKTWLAGRMLVKVDRASMAHGLEVRSPYLDHTLFQWATSLPAHLKVSGGHGKIILKRSLEPLVPNELLYRRKQGFDVPLSEWIRGALQPEIHRAITSPTLYDAGVLNPGAVSEIFHTHVARKADHSAVLWSVYMFERFLAREAAA